MSDSIEEIVDSSSPKVEAYESAKTEGLKGRFAANTANIRLFKDNPYIKDLPKDERSELNKTLLTPYQGEHFYDDDYYDYVCHYEKDVNSGEVSYVYTSKAKELFDRMKYFETQGVLNQLISAYNNGRVYRFYVDRGNRMMYPDSALSFPTDYISYTVKKQGLNANNQAVFVAGILTDGELASTKIHMNKTIDSINGTEYRRMTAAAIFANSEPDDKNYDVVVNNNFYVVDFYNEAGTIIDSKLFQTVDSTIDNIAYPSVGVTRLDVELIRGNYTLSSPNNVYPLLTGETIDGITFRLIATYSNGDKRDITNLIDTGHISIEGKEMVNSTGSTIGKTFPVTFVYYPDINEDGLPINGGSSVQTEIVFQIVQNNLKGIDKIIPTVWETTSTNGVVSSNKTYALKLWTITSDKIIENRTKTLYDTLKILDNNGNPQENPGIDVTYNSYTQSVEFVVTSSTTTVQQFSFDMYSNNSLINYKIKINLSSTNGIFVDATGMGGEAYTKPNGVLSSLTETMYNEATVDFGIYNTTSSKITLTIPSSNNISFKERYKTNVNGITIAPNGLQIYMVKDYSYQPLTDVISIGDTDKSVTGVIIDSKEVNAILTTSKMYDHLLVKFFTKDVDGTKLINFDTFRISNIKR